MSEILTIDTTSGIVTEEKIESLPVFNDFLPMLSEVVPEYKHSLPNPIMTNLEIGRAHV